MNIIGHVRVRIRNVNCDTQVGDGLADTSNNREAIPQPNSEQANMFTNDKTDYVVFFVLAFALVGALIG